jgi:isopentenyldiphosphate isomerase
LSEEYLEIVNERGEVLGLAPRSKIHGDPSLLHRVVHVLVFDPDGKVLLQKRSMNKDVAPGRWDTSVGGHVDPKEGLIEAAMREMEEELGIRAQVEFLYTYKHSNPYETELVHTYKCVLDGNCSLSFNREEIDELRFWGIDEIKSAFGSGILSDNFEHEIRTYLNYSL